MDGVTFEYWLCDVMFEGVSLYHALLEAGAPEKEAGELAFEAADLKNPDSKAKCERILREHHLDRNPPVRGYTGPAGSGPSRVPLMRKATQEQMFYAAQRASADTLQHVLWLAGLDSGNPNPNPLTRAEVEKMALDKRRDSWAFEAVLRVLDNQPPSEGEE